MDPQHRLLLETTYRALENGLPFYPLAPLKILLMFDQREFRWRKFLVLKLRCTQGRLLMTINLYSSRIM